MNLYAFVLNDPQGFIDLLGTDFIAVASRPVNNSLGQLDHYSIQYWLACPGEAPKYEEKISDWQWFRKGAKKVRSVQLLRDNTGWRIWQLDKGKWKLVDTSVSVIHFSDSGDKFVSVFDGQPLAVRSKWRQIANLSKSYPYAEQSSFSGSVMNWPNSKYGMPWDKPFNNSNTFVRDTVKNAGLNIIDLSGSHPGNDSPVPVPDLYGGKKPFNWPVPPMPPSSP